MEDIYCRTFPKCECGGELMILEEDVVFGYKHCTDAIVIYCECIVCGQDQFQFFEITDFIDIEREFLATYREKPKELPPEGGEDEKE